MTTQFLLPDLERDEAIRLIAYPDPLTKGPPWTIGAGHTGREVHSGLVWTMEQALAALNADVAAVIQGLNTSLPWWTTLSEFRQDALANMAFNLGVHGLLKFNTFLALMKEGNYQAAGDDLRDHTAWYNQVGDRAKRIRLQIITNQHQE